MLDVSALKWPGSNRPRVEYTNTSLMDGSVCAANPAALMVSLVANRKTYSYIFRIHNKTDTFHSFSYLRIHV